jgi:hypothetical protein
MVSEPLDIRMAGLDASSPFMESSPSLDALFPSTFRRLTPEGATWHTG